MAYLLVNCYTFGAKSVYRSHCLPEELFCFATSLVLIHFTPEPCSVVVFKSIVCAKILSCCILLQYERNAAEQSNWSIGANLIGIDD